DQIAFAGKADMAGVKLTLGVEQIRVDALMRQRTGGKRRDELLCGLGQHAADMNVPLLQPPDQFQRLEGGDATADDQGDVRFASGADGLRSLRGGPSGRRRHRCAWKFGAPLYELSEDDPDFLF